MPHIWDAKIKCLLTQIEITEERIRVDVIPTEYAMLVWNDLISPETTFKGLLKINTGPAVSKVKFLRSSQKGILNGVRSCRGSVDFLIS